MHYIDIVTTWTTNSWLIHSWLINNWWSNSRWVGSWSSGGWLVDGGGACNWRVQITYLFVVDVADCLLVILISRPVKIFDSFSYLKLGWCFQDQRPSKSILEPHQCLTIHTTRSKTNLFGIRIKIRGKNKIRSKLDKPQIGAIRAATKRRNGRHTRKLKRRLLSHWYNKK